MIHGIGTDIVAIARMRELLDTHGERFLHRILAEEEVAELPARHRQAAFLAKRFAAKEAAAKALGLGFRQGISLRHILVIHDDVGKPGLRFVDRALELARKMNIDQAHISIADEREYAVAFVTLTRQPGA